MSPQPLVGIVVVSHSWALAQAAVALAHEMAPDPRLRVSMAAGLDTTTFGTDAARISQAIIEADAGAGVVVIMDLGSAVLAADLALEFLDEELRNRVLLCAAPMVEGLIVAAVTAAGGGDRREVAAEANNALAAKRVQLNLPSPEVVAPESISASQQDAGAVATFIVENRQGLHLRPAAQLVQLVRSLDANVTLINRTTGVGPVPASSLSRVETLGALAGHLIEVNATGLEADKVIAQIVSMAAHRFHAPNATTDQRPKAARPPTDSVERRIGIGPTQRLTVPSELVVAGTPTQDAEQEWLVLTQAVSAVQIKVQSVREQAAVELGEHQATIFDAHLMLLDDPALLDDVRDRINAGEPAASAWAGGIATIRSRFEALPDPYLRARAADVQAVGDDVLRALLGTDSETRQDTRSSTAASILIAADLTPAEVVGLDVAQVIAIVLADGSPTDHSAILARAKGIPLLNGMGSHVLTIPDGTLVALDTVTRELVVDPSATILESFRNRALTANQAYETARTRSAAAAITSDGLQIQVGANLASLDDALAAATSGADEAGLVRTEFLFLDRSAAPDVDEQARAYLELASAMGGRRLTLRTLDVGGDKPLGYAPTPAETNPFLGLRGLRLSLAQPELIADQLLAIVRTAHDTPVSVLFPMVSTVNELMQARQLLDSAIARDGRGLPQGFTVGIMIEVPAAALKAAAFAPYVDFFSIGTNDLTQYTLAAQRGNRAVAAIADPLDPSVIRLIDMVCHAAGDKPVAVCGELAADAAATSLLVGLGVRALSVVPNAVPTIKQSVRAVNSIRARELADRAIDADGADAVRTLFVDPN